MAKTNGKRNRRAGHSFELFTAALLRKNGFTFVVTCRSENRHRDSLGIDLMNTNEYENGRLEYNIQCKNSTERPRYDTLLGEMPKTKDTPNVIFHKYTEKKNSSFVVKGYFAILSMDDFIEMARELKELRQLKLKP